MRYVTAFLAFVATIFAAIFYRSEAKRQKQQAKINEDESEALSRINEALIAGQDVYDKITDTQLDRNHFAKRRVLSIKHDTDTDI